ncbi:MAG: hypothetical protein MJ228_06025 [Bacilli bacterium]|nr:hypothetical protein [Bacilli bacterium]
MENKKIQNVAKEARSIYGSQLKKTAPFLFFFFLITIMVWLILLLLNYSGLGSLLLTILVIGAIEMPFFLAVQICSYMTMNGEEINFQGFFRTSSLYFKREFNGVYRVINCFLFALLMTLLGSILFSIGYYFFSPTFDPSFVTDVRLMMDAMEAGENGTLETLLNESKSFLLFENLFALVVEMIFVMTTVFKISRNCAMVFVRDFLMSPDPRLPAMVYKQTLKANKEYNKDFYGATWFVYLAIAVFYVIGLVVAYFLFEGHGFQGMLMNMMGIGFGMVPAFILLPYFLNVVYFVTAKHKKSFLESSIDMARRAFGQILTYNGAQMTEEERKKVEDALSEYEKQVRKVINEDEDEVVEEEDQTKNDIHDNSNLDDYGSSDHH